jgi:uncharacterized membrane protein
MSNEKLRQLLDTENEQLQKLNDIVVRAVEEERLISQKLYDFDSGPPSRANRVADAMAAFGGSWKFIITFALLMIFWMMLNVYLLRRPFDPFPFILLNLLLSSIAALQAPIIMMSQNRKEDRDRQRATNDYLVNLKAEIEVQNLHRKIDLLMSEQMKTLFQIQEAQVDLMEEIKTGIGKKE